MGCKYIIVGSVTYAMKSKEVLDNQGIYCKIERIKKAGNYNGCGFALKVDSLNAVNAVRFLNIAGIKVLDTTDCEAIH